MNKFLLWIFRKLNLRCCRDDGSIAVGIYYLDEACACDKRKIQWLCAQHLVSLEPCEKMKCLIKIHDVEGY